MISASTLLTTASTFLTTPLVDVRCPNCGKLICKWEYTGIANLEVKCARCGSINVIRLSTR